MRCLKKHTQKSPHFISFPLWIIRATSYTLRGNRGLRIGVESFVQQVARYEGIVNYASGLNYSCIEMHATRESWITYCGWFVRATSCTLRGNRESRTEVESFVQQVARYAWNRKCPKGLDNVPLCNKLYVTNKKSTTFSCRAFLLSEFTD